MLSAITKSFNKKGFTLIELLVVLGILGILAAALLAAINPVEQLNKAQDTSLKNTATQFQEGVVQYYSTHNDLPWDGTDPTVPNCYPSGGGTLTGIGLDQLTPCIDDLVADGDLKASFKDAANLKYVFVTNPNPETPTLASSTVSCFAPKSASQKSDPLTKFTQSGGACAAGGTCYWCAQ